MEPSESGRVASTFVEQEAQKIPSIVTREDRVRAFWVWAIALSAGVVSTLISWAGGEWAHEAFKPQLFEIEIMSGGTMMLPTTQSMNVAEYKNATLAFAIFGSVTGLVMGISGGLVGRSWLRGLLVGLGAQAAGVLVGYVASLALLRFFYRGYVLNPNDLLTPILVHGALWMVIGAVGGSAFAIGMGLNRRILSAITGAAAGGFFASILYQTLSASFYPAAYSIGPLADQAPVRLLAMASAAVMIGVGSAWGIHGRRRYRPASFPSTP